MSDFDFVKEQIRDAVDIVDLVGQYVPLRRQGSMYVGRCPWHDDSRPSLQINPQRQSFKCWVCDIGGDIFSFVMKIENADFPEALAILSEKTGIALPKKQRQAKEIVGTDGEVIDKRTLFKAAGYVADLYHRALLDIPEAEVVRQYLIARNIDSTAIERFRIGYAPVSVDFLRSKIGGNLRRQKILETIGNWKNGKDFFGGRLIFPIVDERGNTVAFGGRLVPNSPLSNDDWHKDRKYLNTSETPIFSKHRILYGLDAAKQAIKETRSVLIMEGYTDCIMAHRFGFTNAVAVLGTALGRDHIKLLSRLGAEKMILMLDGDKAGQSKAQSDQVLTDFISQGADMSVLILPENLDPCEYLEKYGADELKSILETKSVNALDHIIRVKAQGIDTKTDIIASSKALNEIIAITAHTPPQQSPNDPVAFRIEKVLQTLSVRFDMPLDEIKKRFSELQQSVRERTANRPDVVEESDQTETASVTDIPFVLPDPLEREMLELWLAEPATMNQFWETVPLERCRSPITQAIYMKCSELVEHGRPATIQNLLTAFDSPEIKNFLVTLADSSDEKYRMRMMKSLQVAVTEIEAAFDRREERYTQLKHINQIKDNRLSDDEKLNELLQIQQTLRQKQRPKNE